MRNITFEAVNSFMSKKPFSKSNTTVTVNNNIAVLKLHGNSIAWLDENNEISITNAGWQSNTTKERLNAIQGVRIIQKNFVWYLNGKEWNGEKIKVGI